jgi:hypothetical protein
MPDIELDKDWYDNELLCPVCNANNLHHDSVSVYHRREDEEAVRVTTVDGSELVSSVVPNKTSGNPSGRRDGVVISFWCEHCHANADEDFPDHPALFHLEILQHKGTTYLNWKTPKN